MLKMQYNFKNITPHNYLRIIIRHLPRFILPVAIVGAIDFFFGNSAIASNNFHLYFLLAGELFALYTALTDDSVNEIIIDTANRKIWFQYYNIFHGQMEEKYSFDVLRVEFETTNRDVAKKIHFYMKKGLALVLKRGKIIFLNKQ